jgi:hypothetical protein
MKHAVTLWLETDSVDWFKTVAANLSRQRKREVSLSEAVDYVSQMHWKKTIQRMVDQKHADKVGDRLKGSRLVRPGGKSAAISVTK